MSTGNTIILTGDSREQLAQLPDNSIDAIVTDPPYGLSKEPDALEVLRHWLAGDDYEHTGSGFMGKTWDSFVPGPTLWREVLRVLKPGGHACVFAGSRTVDLMGLSLRIAGFEIRDQLSWLYGTGFPKSLDVSKAIGKFEGIEPVETPHPTNACPGGKWCECDARDERAQSGATKHPPHRDWPEGSAPAAWSGFGTALKPAHEPIILARKPLSGTVAANVLAHGTGGLNVDGCRIAGAKPATTRGAGGQHGVTSPRGAQGRIEDDGLGRWPANVILDEHAGALLDEQTPELRARGNKTDSTTETNPVSCYGKYGASECGVRYNRGDSGGASRFFYCAKASRAEREAGLEQFRKASAGELTGGRAEGSAGLDNPRAGAGRKSAGRANIHPTVKPLALMRWLCRLVTPPGGLVLDPFAGSGTTVAAAALEGFRCVGIELDPEYADIARARVEHWCTLNEQ